MPKFFEKENITLFSEISSSCGALRDHRRMLSFVLAVHEHTRRWPHPRHFEFARSGVMHICSKLPHLFEHHDPHVTAKGVRQEIVTWITIEAGTNRRITLCNWNRRTFIFLSGLTATPRTVDTILKQMEARRHDTSKPQTSPRPPIATVSQTALTASSHIAPSNPRRPCTPLNLLRTSSTALVPAALTSTPPSLPPAPEPTLNPAPAIIAAAAAVAADEGDMIALGLRRRSKRRSIPSAGSRTQRRKSGA